MQIDIQKLDMQTGNGVIEGIALLYMSVCTVFDIRHREIPLMLIIFGTAAAFGVDLWQINGGVITMAEVGISLLPGVFFLLTSFITGEKVGYGDGLLLIAAGFFSVHTDVFLLLASGLYFLRQYPCFCYCCAESAGKAVCRLHRFFYWEWGW